MKKIALTVAALAATANFIYAVDVSYETGADQSIKKDKSMTIKKGNEKKSSDRKFDSRIDAKAYTSDITFDPTPIYIMRANECVKTIAVATDFGLSVVEDEDGVIDMNRKNYIDSAASTSLPISKIAGAREQEVKNYIACIVGEGARMAQANLNLQKRLGASSFSSREISSAAVETFDETRTLIDQSIRVQYAQAIASLQKPCRFIANLGRDSIQCGTLTFSFIDNSVKQAGTLLSVGQNIYGLSSQLRVSLSDTSNVGTEIAKENSSTSSRDASLTKTGSNSLNRSNKKTTNVSPFIPK